MAIDPGEEQDGERRTEVVEDGAPDEEHLRWRSGRVARDPPREGRLLAPTDSHADIVAAGVS